MPPPAAPDQDQVAPAAPLPPADAALDCEGLLCPLPVLRARKRLMAMAPGQVLAVTATDRMAALDLPHFCAQSGHDYLGQEPAGKATRHLIRRGAAVRGADSPDPGPVAG